ncbi:hypothetical protein PsYK624_082230 [Phanerochaete sordida]|uniref:Fungal-type protein kinase domain-containing protein n=1 Tax=Phanerochaete sordida TaxID=48140 RepID=A0A9P3GE27_9APHY|nr:hypothetical protein PsYK624_082230 [Phanerochaete sordida]
MRNTIGANAARGRILRSTQALFARQHRTFLFSLVLAGTRARFLLLDRSGVLISESFDYVHSPDVLAGFLWRFAHMDAAARGLDASAVLATRHEAALFADAVHAFLDPAEPSHAARALPDAELSLDHTDTYPIWKITVPGAAGPTELVAQRPFAGRPALVGRCMRGYLAYDLHARRLVFLKDTWRWDEPRLRPECDVYRQLEEAGVPSVPRVEYGGDVGGADGSGTRVGGLCEEKPEWLSVGRGLKGFVHHRVVQDVTYSLDTVRDERELIQALHDTIIALDKTYDDLGILHRDLSVENIRLDAHSRCVLSDWDCAGPPARSGEPFGTSQFMSTRLHYDPPCQNTLTDDLQSVFWVLAVVATSRFARTRAGLPHALLAPEPGTCGLAALVNAKAEVLRRGGKLWEARFGCKALEELLGGLTEAWGEYSRAGEGDMCDARSGEIRDQVARPDFWRKKFAAALRVLDEEEAARDGLSAAVPTSCAGSKRKAVEDLDECVCRGARRSKRLRAMRDGARCL